MSEITIPARKFQRLLDYLQRIGLDANAIAGAVDLSLARIAALNPEQGLPALNYSRLYKAASAEMQRLGQPIPWGAGLGSEAFELMCHCMIGARTLGDALRLAQRYNELLYPLNGYCMRLLDDADTSLARLEYRIDVPDADSELVPRDWDRAEYTDTVARSSGLVVWHAYCGWLTGDALTAQEVHIQAPVVSREHRDSLERIFACPVHFDADESTFSFKQELLQRRIVHTTESLNDFLRNSVYHLIALDRIPASTTAAIKSLVSIDLPNGTPSFAAVASMLYMSESSLRRRLQSENTSYQAIKDEVRCEVAIDKLLHENARVADLADYLGFTEASSFVRSFKSWTGLTPKAYKDRMEALARVIQPMR
ncbi:MAG: AraC family transcriptional regulator ligand-binding domain-containing protein [Pseudomonadales bacterium]|nr:AraC family transcriptional regulator ligand-binding domain-containing protein [Halieaceae bacterium]MCP5187836.1 AraC family transcriptional regulator ligand-binding domain-containing protein [Pseudomonadales bacterium]